jgi:hypothetical protein
MPKVEYIEHLRANGASEDDIKALTEGSFAATAIKSFDVAQTRIAAETAAAVKAKADAVAYQEKADKWWNEQAIPEYQKMERESTLAKANEARIVAAIKASQDEGLKAIAKEMGYPVDGTTALPDKKTVPDGFEASKYVTTETLLQVAEREGDAIAIASDIAFEHRQLFPDKPLNFREMRKAAVAAKKPVEQYWMETFGVTAAREAAATARQKAHDDALIAQGAAAEREKLVSQYGNPDARPLQPSTSPFAVRKETGRDKQPWEAGESNLERDRVTRATKHVVEIAQKTA